MIDDKRMRTDMEPELTRKQEKRLRSIERRFRECIKDLEELSIELGGDPLEVAIYFEADGSMHASRRFGGGYDGS